MMYYFNNRVLPSKALSCDKLPEEMWCLQQILARERSSIASHADETLRASAWEASSSRAYMKFEHQVSDGTYHTEGLRQKDSIVFVWTKPTSN